MKKNCILLLCLCFIFALCTYAKNNNIKTNVTPVIGASRRTDLDHICAYNFKVETAKK